MSLGPRIFQQFDAILERLYAKVDIAERSRIKFNPPATIEEIKHLESVIGLPMPPDFYDLYLTHNGAQNPDTIYGEQWLPIEEILSEWSNWNEVSDEFEDNDTSPSPGVSARFWHHHWVPITSDSGGNSYCMDLAPDFETGGRYGQIIRMWHDSDDRDIHSGSLIEFFEHYLDQIDSGKRVFDRDYDYFVETADISGDIYSLALYPFEGSDVKVIDIDFSNIDCNLIAEDSVS